MNAIYLGLLAGTLTSIAAIPQVLKTLRTRNVRDISIWQPLLFTVGVALWLAYGIMLHNQPLILSNIIPLVCNAWLVVLKMRWRDV
ncbi:MAG: SemiSWEET transporter [Deltaproteobacteria bacterium]